MNLYFTCSCFRTGKVNLPFKKSEDITTNSTAFENPRYANSSVELPTNGNGRAWFIIVSVELPTNGNGRAWFIIVSVELPTNGNGRAWFIIVSVE